MYKQSHLKKVAFYTNVNTYFEYHCGFKIIEVNQLMTSSPIEHTKRQVDLGAWEGIHLQCSKVGVLV